MAQASSHVRHAMQRGGSTMITRMPDLPSFAYLGGTCAIALPPEALFAYFPCLNQCRPKMATSSGTTGAIGLETHVVLTKCFQVMFSLAMLPPQVPHPSVSENGMPLT